jgi:hypothetical protein
MREMANDAVRPQTMPLRGLRRDCDEKTFPPAEVNGSFAAIALLNSYF